MEYTETTLLYHLDTGEAEELAADGGKSECLAEDGAFGAGGNGSDCIIDAAADEYTVDCGAKVVECCFLALTQPVALAHGPGNPQAHATLLGVGGEGCLFGGFLGRVAEVDVAKLVERGIGAAAVGIVGDCLETAVEQGLAHHVEVDAQGVEELDAAVGAKF